MITTLIQLRKELHQHPEVSSQESTTAQRIKKFIDLHCPTKIIDQIGGNGLAAIYKFSESGPTITIRCELDALPIQEVNTFPHQSTVGGVSHKCGHDGHMAIVAGLIFWIKKQYFHAGKIVLLFQPAEETGQGAFQVLEDPRFQALNSDYIFALHNIPGMPLHNIITMNQGFSAEVQSFFIKIKGKKSHASEPEHGINPAQGIAEMITELSKLNIHNPSDENFTILTPVHLNMGQIAYGISPADGELHYTIRTWSSQKMDILKLELNQLFKRICEAHQLKYDVQWLEYFPASKNDSTCNNIVTKAALANNFEVITQSFPFKFGEDFGWFSKKYKTAMFGLGAGLDTPTLHNAYYDFPDEIIETGMSMFKTIILEIMKTR